MTKHTPGPWEIDHVTRAADICTVYCTSHQNSFVYVRGAIGYFSGCRDENMANAYLIAAAPDLLGALIEIQNHAGSDSVEMWTRVNAAIKKATGGAA
jgi:hypothetical protein